MLASLADALAHFELYLPDPVTRQVQPELGPSYAIDVAKQRVFSSFLRLSCMPMPSFVRQLRGEIFLGPRPNKALSVPLTSPGWTYYRHRTAWETIVREGVRPNWGKEWKCLRELAKKIRKGQDANRYLVLDIDLVTVLDGITCSPFGEVPMETLFLRYDARIIHDISFPPSSSVNDHTEPTALVEVAYDGAHVIAERILGSRPPVKMMTGDINETYRNVPIR